MKKLARRSLIIDRLHKGLVLGCIAVTIYGTAHFGLRWYRYFTVLKPEQRQRELLEKEQLLAEGASENLKDIATNLKA